MSVTSVQLKQFVHNNIQLANKQYQELIEKVIIDDLVIKTKKSLDKTFDSRIRLYMHYSANSREVFLGTEYEWKVVTNDFLTELSNKIMQNHNFSKVVLIAQCVNDDNWSHDGRMAIRYKITI